MHMLNQEMCFKLQTTAWTSFRNRNHI